jgi:DNA replication protein DnaC
MLQSPHAHVVVGTLLSATKVTAAAMIDRLVHHAEVRALKGRSNRLRDRDAPHTPVEN